MARTIASLRETIERERESFDAHSERQEERIEEVERALAEQEGLLSLECERTATLSDRVRVLHSRWQETDLVLAQREAELIAERDKGAALSSRIRDLRDEVGRLAHVNGYAEAALVSLDAAWKRETARADAAEAVLARLRAVLVGETGEE